MIKAKISSGSMRGRVDPYARMNRHIEAPELDHADGSVTKEKLADDVLELFSSGCVHIGSETPADPNVKIWIDPEGVSGGTDEAGIPAYCEYEAVRVGGVIRDKLKALSTAGHSALVFGAVTDNHVANKHKWIDANGNLQEITALQDVLTKASIRHGAYALKYVSDLAGCDFIANLGDNNWENNIDSDNAYTAGMYTRDTLLPAFDEASGGCFGFHLVGNHDQTNDIARQWELIGKNNSFDVTGTTAERCYGYKDFADKKVRVICLNTSDYLNGTGGYGMSYEQRAFLMSALDLSDKEDCADWKILLLSHIPLDFYSADYDVTKDVIGILQAYVNGEAYTITVNDSWASIHDDATTGTLTYDYAGKNSAKIIGNIHGHLHNDCHGMLVYTDTDGNTVSANIVRVSTPNTCFYLGKGESYPNNGDYAAEQITKVQDTAQDTAVTFYVVDLTDNVIYSFAYGAGNDREINYIVDVNTYSVKYVLTGCSSDSDAATVAKGGSFTANITPDDGMTLTGCTVTMGGVDVTSTVYADGVITIPEVTGNIVITAAAEVATTYTNLFTAATITSPARLQGDGSIEYNSNSCWVTESYLSVTAGDIVRIYTPNGKYDSSFSQRVVVFYKQNEDDSYTYVTDLRAEGCTTSKEEHLITFTVPAVEGEEITHIRVSGFPSSDYGNVIITINQPIFEEE